MVRHLVTLGDLAARQRMLNVACSRCTRRGRLSLARLIAEHGADTPVRVATADINADCPRLAAWTHPNPPVSTARLC